MQTNPIKNNVFIGINLRQLGDIQLANIRSQKIKDSEQCCRIPST